MRPWTSFAAIALSFPLAACYFTDAPVIRSGEAIGFAGQYTCLSDPYREPEMWRIEPQSDGPDGHEYGLLAEKGNREPLRFTAKALENGFFLLQVRGDSWRDPQNILRMYAGTRPLYFYVQQRRSGSLTFLLGNFDKPEDREAVKAYAARYGVTVGGMDPAPVKGSLMGLLSGDPEAVRQFLEHPAFPNLSRLVECRKGDLRVRPAGAAEPVLSELEAVQQIQKLFSGKYGVHIRMGEQRFSEAELAEGGSSHEFAETVAALEDIGVIMVEDVPTEPGRAHFRIAASPDLNKAELSDGAGGKYLRYAYTPDDVEISSIERVKGGATNWDGAVVHANLTIDSPTELCQRYLERRGRPLVREKRFRFLFRYDPARKTWSYVTLDGGPRDRDFMTQNVPRKLRETD